MTLEDRVERLEKAVATQTEIVESIVKILDDDDKRINDLRIAFEHQSEIDEIMLELFKRNKLR